MDSAVDNTNISWRGKSIVKRPHLQPHATGIQIWKMLEVTKREKPIKHITKFTCTANDD